MTNVCVYCDEENLNTAIDCEGCDRPLLQEEKCQTCPTCSDELDTDFYFPSGSEEYYCEICDVWYNQFLQELRSPKEYDKSSEGYTPFGDEGDY